MKNSNWLPEWGVPLCSPKRVCRQSLGRCIVSQKGCVYSLSQYIYKLGLPAQSKGAGVRSAWERNFSNVNVGSLLIDVSS